MSLKSWNKFVKIARNENDGENDNGDDNDATIKILDREEINQSIGNLEIILSIPNAPGGVQYSLHRKFARRSDTNNRLP